MKIATLLITFLIIPITTFALDVKSVFDQSRPSVVLIVAYDSNNQPSGIGSGFFIGDGKSIATNYHVISNAADLKIKASDGQIGNVVSILGLNEKNDLALLEVDIQGVPLTLSNNQPDIGEDILAIGNPSGLEGTVSTGIVSGIRTEEGSQYFQITAPISPGSSGGPIINENSEVVGVASFYLDGAQSLNFAMPAAYLTKLYNERVQTSLATLKKTPEKKLNRTEGNVVILAPEWGTCYTNDTCDLSFSIGNKSQYEVSNIKILIKIFEKLDDELPLHFVLKRIDDKIPSRLSKRQKIQYVPTKRSWKPKFIVMDYEINQSNSSGTLLNFD